MLPFTKDLCGGGAGGGGEPSSSCGRGECDLSGRDFCCHNIVDGGFFASCLGDCEVGFGTGVTFGLAAEPGPTAVL